MTHTYPHYEEYTDEELIAKARLCSPHGDLVDFEQRFHRISFRIGGIKWFGDLETGKVTCVAVDKVTVGKESSRP